MTTTLWDKPGLLTKIEREWAFPSSCRHRQAMAGLIGALDVPRGSLLDAGCGIGLYHDELVPVPYPEAAYTGIDWSATMLDRARARHPTARFVQADIHQLPWPDATFDLVICCEVLGHLATLAPAVRELWRVARHALFFSLWIDEPAVNADHRSYRLKDVWAQFRPERWWLRPDHIVAFEVRR